MNLVELSHLPSLTLPQPPSHLWGCDNKLEAIVNVPCFYCSEAEWTFSGFCVTGSQMLWRPCLPCWMLKRERLYSWHKNRRWIDCLCLCVASFSSIFCSEIIMFHNFVVWHAHPETHCLQRLQIIIIHQSSRSLFVFLIINSSYYICFPKQWKMTVSVTSSQLCFVRT